MEDGQGSAHPGSRMGSTDSSISSRTQLVTVHLPFQSFRQCSNSLDLKQFDICVVPDRGIHIP